MEEAVTALLLSDPALKLFVADRVHWGRIPQGKTGTAIVLQVISGEPDYTMAGRSGLEASRVQVDGYALTALDAKNACNAALAVLGRHRGMVGDVHLQGGFISSRRDFQPDAAGGSERLFRRSSDIIIWHSS